MFQLTNISKAFGATQALSNLSLSITQGEQLALIGPSGSGKTTLLKSLNAQIVPTTGHVRIGDLMTDKVSPKKLKSIRGNIAYIPQDLGLVPSLKVFQNILLGQIGHTSTPHMLKKFLLPSSSDLDEIFRLLKTVGIPEKLYQPTSSLSGGQRQRVAVARALFQKAHTILADEPISAVDPARAKSLINLLDKITQENNITLVMSIHNVDLAQQYFKRIVGLKEGTLEFDTTAITPEMLESLYRLDAQQLLKD